MSDTELTAVVPRGTGAVDVTVTSPYGTSLPNGGDRFTYRCGAEVTLTLAAYRKVASPASNGCWRLDRITSNLRTTCRKNAGQFEIVSATKPRVPGYWVYDDTVESLNTVSLINEYISPCAQKAATDAKAGSPASATDGYLFTAFREGKSDFVGGRLPSRSEVEGIRRAVASNITVFYEAYDAQYEPAPCPSEPPISQSKCLPHPLLTPDLYSAWKASAAGTVPMLDATPSGTLSTEQWNTPQQVREATSKVCKDVAGGEGLMAINVGSGASGSGVTPPPMPKSYVEAISDAMNKCTT